MLLSMEKDVVPVRFPDGAFLAAAGAACVCSLVSNFPLFAVHRLRLAACQHWLGLDLDSLVFGWFICHDRGSLQMW